MSDRPADPEGELPAQVDPDGVPPPPQAFVRVDPYIGKTLDGRYLVERKLGEGGMGVVYGGRHTVIDKRVAIKVLRREMADTDDATHRFLTEARAASAVGSPYICDVSDFGKLPDGADYFVMEYLDGKSLSRALDEERPMATPRILAIGRQIARGLAEAHAAGIIHRDLKPDNVMLVARGGEKDQVKILDFGIAKVTYSAQRITEQGSVFGTPLYMSPEQASGASVDHRCDVYALGVILYELATGRVPFGGENYMAILSQHVHRSPPRPSLAPGAEGMPPALEDVVLRCLAKAPDDRYVSMAALAEDLEAIARGAPIAIRSARAVEDAAPATRDERPLARRAPAGPSATLAGLGAGQALAAAPARRRRGATLAVAGGLAIGGAFAFALARGGARVEPPPPESAPPPPRAAELALAAAAGAAGATSAEAPSRPPAAPALEAKQVLVGVDPPDARVARDGTDLGEAPVALALAPGESATLVVTRAGYRSQTVTIDGALPKRVVRLAPLARPVVPGPAGVPNDLGDPWKR